jgi:hypothetical protein
MKLVTGNLWDSTDSIILVTANSFIKSNGELAMGRGAALELANRIPFVKFFFGDQIKRYYGHLGNYGVLIMENSEGYPLVGRKGVGIFQTKYHYKYPANLDLIKCSCKKLLSLMEWLDSEGNKVSMNFPGIGNGGLSFQSVLPIVEVLPDNISLYIK